MRELGFSRFNIGVEPEFILFERDLSGKPTLTPQDTGGYFDLAPVDMAEQARRDIVFELQKIGFEIEASHHEVAPGQHEINFEFDDAVKACDRLQLFKWVVKNVARRHNLYASFMPKPISSVNGSGMHTNCSLSNEKGNAFDDASGVMGLSDIARYWIAGILSHARGFTAITNPLVNSYKRLVPGFEAPCYIAYSDANRSALIRIPAIRGKATRTEVRSVDPSANPYLAMTVILASGLDGIVHQMNSVKPVSINLYEVSEDEREKMGILSLPQTLNEAIYELEHDRVIKDALGPHVFSRYIAAKKEEWKNYSKSVTQWELDHYLNRY
jgi:glutamine synthetase